MVLTRRGFDFKEPLPRFPSYATCLRYPFRMDMVPHTIANLPHYVKGILPLGRALQTVLMAPHGYHQPKCLPYTMASADYTQRPMYRPPKGHCHHMCNYV